MKTKESAKNKKQHVTLKDLKTRKNPKGGIGGNSNANVTTGGSGNISATFGGSSNRR